MLEAKQVGGRMKGLQGARRGTYDSLYTTISEDGFHIVEVLLLTRPSHRNF